MTTPDTTHVSTSTPITNARVAVENAADHVAEHGEGAIQKTRAATNQALDALQSGVDDLRQAIPSTVHRVTGQVDELARRSIDRARATGLQVKDKVVLAGDRSVGYIRDEPVKSVLIAVAAGAALAALLGWVSRPSASRR